MEHWSKVSSEIKKLRDNPKSAEEEKKSYLNRGQNNFKSDISFRNSQEIKF